MDLIELLKLLFRRWPVVVPIIVLTVLAGAYLTTNPTETYMASGSLTIAQVAEVESAGTGEVLDPLVVTQLLPDMYGSGGVRADLVAQGHSTDFQVTTTDESPVVHFAVTAPTADEAVNTTNYLLSVSPTLLEGSFGAAAQSVEVRSVARPAVADAQPNDDGTFSVAATALVTQRATSTGTNPFTPSDATLDLLVELSNGPEFFQAVGAVDPSATFVVVFDRAREAPLLTTTATASTAGAVAAVYETGIAQLQATLTDLQDEHEAPPELRSELREVLPPAGPFVTSSSVVRAFAGVVVLGSGLAVGAAILADTVLARRRDRKRVGVEPAEASITDTPAGLNEADTRTPRKPPQTAAASTPDARTPRPPTQTAATSTPDAPVSAREADTLTPRKPVQPAATSTPVGSTKGRARKSRRPVQPAATSAPAVPVSSNEGDVLTPRRPVQPATTSAPAVPVSSNKGDVLTPRRPVEPATTSAPAVPVSSNKGDVLTPRRPVEPATTSAPAVPVSSNNGDVLTPRRPAG